MNSKIIIPPRGARHPRRRRRSESDDSILQLYTFNVYVCLQRRPFASTFWRAENHDRTKEYYAFITKFGFTLYYSFSFDYFSYLKYTTLGLDNGLVVKLRLS